MGAPAMVMAEEVQELSTNPQFDEYKATQAAAFFLRLSGGRMNYLKLMKLLYLLDRSSLEQRGYAVTNDTYYSMKLGPILSEILDLINTPTAPGESSVWSKHISEPSHYEVCLKSDPGASKLSEREEQLIEQVYGSFGSYEPFALADLLHEKLPEWTPVSRGRVPLSRKKILEAVNKTPDEIREIEEEIASVSLAEALLGVR